MILTEEDIIWLTEKGFEIQPPRAKEKLLAMEDFAQNPFLFLENNRFLKSEFVKFPDEQRQANFQNQTYEIFGKSYKGFFALSTENQGVYLISMNTAFPLIHQINENIRKFTMIYHYFLMSMYQIIAETRNIDFKNEKTYPSEMEKICDKICKNFRKKAKKWDKFAFQKGEASFWRMVYHQMLEADLAFTLYNVSLLDYMTTGRFE